jgi:hypothetical protein
MRNPIDIYILIPIILKTILSIVVPSFGIQTFLIQNGIPLLSIILVSMYRQMRNTECEEKKLETSLFSRLFKSGSNAFILYTIGIITTIIVRFVPFIMVALRVVSKIPFGADIVSSAVWGLGVIIAYALINFGDDTISSAADLCKGKISSIRGIISLIVFVIGIIYQFITE